MLPVVAIAPATGPAAPFVAAAGAIISGVAAILRRGHDDEIGEADGVVFAKMNVPILQEILGVSVQGNWMDVGPKTSDVAGLIPNWPLTADRTVQLLAWGDETLGQWCGQIAGTKWPCKEYVPGKSGAGTLAYSQWQRLRGYMVGGLQVARQREAARAAALYSPVVGASLSPATPVAVPRTANGLLPDPPPSTTVGAKPLSLADVVTYGGLFLLFRDVFLKR